MSRVMVRYRVKPEEVARNEELVRAVFEELERERPAGLRYASFVLDDGVTFVHLAIEPGGGGSRLTETDAFRAFRERIRDRYEEPPLVSELREVGSYRFGQLDEP